MARAGVWGHEQNYTAKVRKPPTPQLELFSLEEEPGGGLPAPLPEVAVQILDLPLPQLVDHVVDALRIPERPMVVQVIEVPKISCSPFLDLLFLSRRQQNSWCKCRPYCLLCASRSRSSAFQFLVVVVSGVFKVLSQDRVQQRRILLANAFLSGLSSRPLTFLLLVVALRRVRPHLQVLQMRILLVFFFALFTMEKSAECRAGGECAAGWARRLIHAERSSNGSCR